MPLASLPPPYNNSRVCCFACVVASAFMSRPGTASSARPASADPSAVRRPLETRVRIRGGRWGIRSLRVALFQVNRDGDGLVAQHDVVAALEKFGIQGFAAAEIDAFFSKCLVLTPGATPAVTPQTTARRAVAAAPAPKARIDAVVDALGGGAMTRKRYGASLQGYRIMLKRCAPRNSKTKPTAIPLDVLCQRVQIQNHPDVVSGDVRLREALYIFWSMWGTDATTTLISEAHWMQFFADWSIAFVHDDDYVAFLSTLWGIPVSDLLKDDAPRIPDRAECDKIFDSIDTNSNGTLSLAELDLACIRLWPALNHKAAIMRAYKLADDSGNGWLDKAEFHRFCFYLPLYADLYTRFKAADTDRDGTVSFDELRYAKGSLGLDDLNDTELRAVFKEIDTNRGGRIGYDEFCMYMARRRGDAAMAKQTNEYARTARYVPPK